jgi:hypothetical protein
MGDYKMNTKKMTDDIIEETDKIIKKFGTRMAGTKASLDTADYLYEDAKGYSDSTHIDDFYIHKGAFLGWINILVFILLGLFSLFLSWK